MMEGIEKERAGERQSNRVIEQEKDREKTRNEREKEKKERDNSNIRDINRREKVLI